MTQAGQKPSAFRRRRPLAGVALAGLLLAACTRALVPLGTTPLPDAPAGELGATPGEWSVPGGGIRYSVFGVPEDAVLLARQPAGISGTIVAELPADTRPIQLTGQSTPLGSSTWVEIALPSGGAGWVNLWNLTEDVDPQAFCHDPRVPALMDTFFSALRERTGEALAQTASPRRGLVLRHDWWNPEIVVPQSDVGDLMQRTQDVDWGVQRGSGAPITGSFRDRMMPELDAMLAATPRQACNQLLAADTGIAARWPSEYAHMNFLSYHVPAPETGTRYSWRTWAIGVEYVDGVPFVAILIRYQGDV